MYRLLQLLTLSLFAGSTCAVFYIPGSVVSYPKMGKRAFYTNATGNRYPLMGRRSSSSSRTSEKRAEEVPAVEQEHVEYNKRGVFTQGPHRSFPRVGRSGIVADPSIATVGAKIRSELLRSLADRLNGNVVDAGAPSDANNLPTAAEGQSSQAGEDNSDSAVPMSHFLFLIFDDDSDGRLTKAEFSSGMEKMIQQNLLC